MQTFMKELRKEADEWTEGDGQHSGTKPVCVCVCVCVWGGRGHAMGEMLVLPLSIFAAVCIVTCSM